MAQHTPGPWENYYWLIRHPTCGTDEDGVPWSEVIATASTDANARLIAAAPDLLTACETALARIESDISNTCAEAVTLRAAIAKARGREAR